MSKGTALLIGGTKMVERHLRRALPEELDMVTLRTLDQAMRRLDEGGVSILVFGPTLRRSLALVQTMRADARYRTVPLVVVYRDDQRADVSRHQEGRQQADAYVMQSKAQRELEAAIEAAMSKQSDGLGEPSDLLEDLPLEAVSALTTEVSEAALAAKYAAVPVVETTLEFDAIEEISDEEVEADETSTVMLDVVAIDDDDDDVLPEALEEAIELEAVELIELEELPLAEVEEISEIDVVAEGDVLPVELVELEEIVAEVELEPEEAEEIAVADDLIEEIEAIDELTPFEVSTVTDIDAEAVELDAASVHVLPDSLEEAAEELDVDLVELDSVETIEEAAIEEIAAVELVEDVVVEEIAAEDLAIEDVTVEEVAVEEVAVEEVAVEEVAVEEVAVEAEVVPKQRARHQSSTELLTSNLNELTSLIGKLQAALADIERLESENAELREAKEAAEAQLGSVSGKGKEAEAAKAAFDAERARYEEQLGAAERTGAAALSRAESAEAKAEAAEAQAEAAEARVTTLQAEVDRCKAELAKRDDAAGAAAALLREAAARLVTAPRAAAED
ncbi:MAG: hypothetical protein H6747_10995 [Deltaproteobacteria bacterium]|nr:hypothetical protein [Deltaproteobacteria bacterium]